MKSGDYSIDGHGENVAIERKSLEDLYSTLTHGRERFCRELERLAEPSYRWSAVVVEASWYDVCRNPPFLSNVRPKSIYRSIIALMQQFPRTHWMLCDTRRLAEVTTYRALERYWTEQVEKPAAELRRQQRKAKGDGTSHERIERVHQR